MGGQPGQGSEPGGADPDPFVPGTPDAPEDLRVSKSQHLPDAAGGLVGSATLRRDGLSAEFAPGGEWDACPPSAHLALALEAASGEDGRCPGATHEELIGLLRQWAALESHVSAAKLDVLCALMREEDLPPHGGHHGDLPDGWSKSLTREVALTLAMSAQSAENMMWLAWDLQARLPGVGRLLADGTLNYGKAKAVDDELNLLTDPEIEQAEQLVLAKLAEDGSPKSFAQVLKLSQQAAITVNPEIATLRRKDAEATKARVLKFREQSGAAALTGRDLPTDQTLSAYANVNARAEEYHASGAFPHALMDQLRSMAFLNLLNNVPAGERIAQARAETARPANEQAESPAGDSAAADKGAGTAQESSQRANPLDPLGPDAADRRDNDGNEGPGNEGPGNEGPGNEGPGNEGPGNDNSDVVGPPDPGNDGPDSPDDPDDAGPDGGGPVGPDGPGPDGPGSDSAGPDNAGPDGPGPDGRGPAGQRPGAGGSAVRPPLTDLVIPLSTLLGWAERPGEGHGLGPLDPDLCRDLVLAAACSPYTELCITVTNADGIAVGHGCVGPPRPSGSHPGRPSGPYPDHHPSEPHPDHPSGLYPGQRPFPARVNLTVDATELGSLTRMPGPPGTRAPARWALTPRADPGPPGGYGTWTLTLPGACDLVVKLEPVPTFECDHRRESHAYQPNDKLRHLVQVRDYECTFPTCSRHARQSDFEHAVPYDKGGRTCACNAGARSRQCHMVKQSPGWNVTQPQPGWHQWRTPGGRTYTQGPYRYPF